MYNPCSASCQRADAPSCAACASQPPDGRKISRSVHPEERRTFLEALGPALSAVALPFVIPKFPTKAGRVPLDKYAAPVGVARRGAALPTCFEVVMLRVQTVANATRRRLARASGGTPTLFSETDVSYSFIINIINPIGHVIGFEEASAEVMRTLRSGKNQEEPLARLCRLEPPFPAAAEEDAAMETDGAGAAVGGNGPDAECASPAGCTRAGIKRDAARSALADLSPRSMQKIAAEFGLMCAPPACAAT